MCRRRLIVIITAISLLVIPINADGNKYKTVYKFHRNNKMKIALSFDDGPHPEYTEEILDILDRYSIKATFFTVGENAREYPDIIKEEIDRGHEIGNHTMTHCYLPGQSPETVKRELEDAAETVYGICDYMPKIFRPPGGVYNESLVRTAENMGYSVILWSVDTRDWAHTPVETITDNVIKNVKSGDILLFHDYIAANSPTPQALERVIPKLIGEGYEFVTVSELIGSY